VSVDIALLAMRVPEKYKKEKNQVVVAMSQLILMNFDLLDFHVNIIEFVIFGFDRFTVFIFSERSKMVRSYI
jgi:hypothetical protein